MLQLNHRGSNMSKDKKITIVYIIGAILVVGVIIFQIINRNTLLNTLEKALYEYFENNNEHIAEHDFRVNNVRIRCIGNNDSYIVEFDILFDDDNGDLKNLGATMYKNGDKWDINGTGVGISNTEIEKYKFKCYR